jgi:hypothetical protein
MQSRTVARTMSRDTDERRMACTPGTRSGKDPSYGVCVASKPASRARLSARGSTGRWVAAACADGLASFKCARPRFDEAARAVVLVTADPGSRMCATPGAFSVYGGRDLTVTNPSQRSKTAGR